jgi:hypothetical protein
MRQITFIVGWLLVLALAQISLNPIVGLLAVVACAVHIGLVLGPRGQPSGTALTLSSASSLTRVVGATVRLPARLLRQEQRPGQADTIGIEVHMADRRRSAEIERLLRGTLRQCARTWAPHPLPVDRIAVHAGAPPAGRAQVYDRWLPVIDPQQQLSASLAVIWLGLLDAAGRPIEDQQLAGALAAQVAALVADRYQREHTDVPATGPVEAQPSPRPSRSAVDLVNPSSWDKELEVLMGRVRRQLGPLEAEQDPPPAAD